uniref:Uncharacterized protein n=1 Tax=Nelumbo nucifera TaxID=4432 RepID=A0A822ZSE8_NELNU|nr:TPA_asm: hypothetical protein HUJ06_017730 [Nelumbo nucifera]
MLISIYLSANKKEDCIIMDNN